MFDQRRPLRRDVTAEVLDRLSSGRLPVGRVNESDLAAELGISRTPLREALLVLEQRGLLDSAMGRGFIVRPLSLDEANELYPLLALLEPEVVRLGADALRARTAELRAVLDAMRSAGAVEALLQLSQQWGTVFRDCCANRRLRAILEDLHRQAARYERANLEHAGMPDGFVIETALHKHAAIIDALDAGDDATAAGLVAATWRDCLAGLAWLPAAPSTQRLPLRRSR